MGAETEATTSPVVSGPPTIASVDEDFLRKIRIPYKLVRDYCRVESEGLDKIPSGPAILACNHTGWLGLDYTNLAVEIHDRLGRIVRGVAHPGWFSRSAVGKFATRVGLVPASVDSIVALLEAGCLVVVFPEAERGAFKDARQGLYSLERFRSGFVRAAIKTKSPIVPVAIVGGEEANPSLGTLKGSRELLGFPLPIPVNLLPNPVKWRIGVLDAVRPHEAVGLDDAARIRDVAADVRRRVGDELRRQIKKRGNPVF